MTLATLLACRDRNAATSQNKDAATPVAVPSAAPSSSKAGNAVDAKQDEVIAVTLAWNAALARRDAPALRRVYGEKVRLYEETIDRDKAIDRKAAAFKAAPDYTQSIASLKVDRSQPERPTIEFLKTWKVGGKESSIRGVLVFGKEGGDQGEPPHLVIVEESDVATDKKRLAALKNEGCWGLVHRVIATTPEGREYGAKGGVTWMVCTPPECEEFQVAAGHFQNEGSDFPSLSRETTFEVNPSTGVVSVSGVAMPADPAIVARLKAACAAEGLAR